MAILSSRLYLAQKLLKNFFKPIDNSIYVRYNTKRAVDTGHKKTKHASLAQLVDS